MTALDTSARRPPSVAVGLGCMAAGAVLALRPFTALGVLVVLVAVAAIVTGVLRALTAPEDAPLPGRLVGAAWVGLGLVVAFWPDLSIAGIAVAVGIGMVVGGAADVVAGLRGTTDERLAAVLKGAASVVAGVVALAWPDVTLLAVAVVFGARTFLFGLSETIAAFRGSRRTDDVCPARPLGPLRRLTHVAVAGLALAAAVALGGVSAALHRGEPVVDDFYAAPDEVPDEPGALLRAEPFTRQVPDGAVAWRILYTTTRADGLPAVASGLVVVPDDAAATHPVVAWAHGTTGVARRCAPSVLAEPFESGALFLLPQVLDAGWALVATDYVGLGTEGPHPYLVGDPTARSVLDAVRAARQLDRPGAALADDTVVWGHSQGGGAALWTGQVQPTYAPDVPLAGVAALAPASDLPGFADTLAGLTGGSIFASYLVEGYVGTYDDVRRGDVVAPGAQPQVRALADRCLSEPAALVSVLQSVTTGFSVFRTPLGGGALGERLAENVSTGPPAVPLLVAQGTDDAIIAPAVQAAYVERLCADGIDVDYRTYDGRDHVGLVTASSPLVPDLLAWTADRLAGEPFASTC